MTTQVLDKIENKSRQEMFLASKNWHQQRKSEVPLKKIIVLNEAYPDNIFLVHENVIYENGSIVDSSYSVWKFDNGGTILNKEDVEKLGRPFFSKMKPIKKIK